MTNHLHIAMCFDASEMPFFSSRELCFYVFNIYSNSKTTADFGSNVISVAKSNVFQVKTSFPDLKFLMFSLKRFVFTVCAFALLLKTTITVFASVYLK